MTMRVSLAPTRIFTIETARLPPLDLASAATIDAPGAPIAPAADTRLGPRDRVCWRYVITTSTTTAIIADLGNHRVLWEAA